VSALSKCREEGLRNGTFEVLEVDLMTLESVRKFADVILKKNIPIHVLVNNGKDFN
jgi:short-subunit dehydrogenase